jgi:16S rRNA (guanine527-N7)-methyltransferase
MLERVREYGVPCPPDCAEGLAVFCRELVSWSSTTGLIGPHEQARLVDLHIAASLGPLLLEPPQPGEAWADLGTGAGLPGLVIKICRPEIPMALVDSSRKKTIFLERVVDRLGLKDVKVIESRIEALHPSPGGQTTLDPPWDVILMRAVAGLAKSLEWLAGVSRPGSRLLTYKGPAWRTELASSESAISMLGWKFVDQIQIPWAPPKLLRLRRARQDI